MSKNSKVTVLMPAYNAAPYIAEAIESIINQTFKDFEFIIIDDCSTDNTRDIIETYAKKDKRIRFFKNERNLKVAKTRNKGLKLAKGEYIVNMDADDWSYPDRIEKQVHLMEENPDLVLSSGNMEICDSKMNIKNKTKLPIKDSRIREVLLQYNPIVNPATIFKRREALQVGGYDETVKTEDYMMVIDLSSKGKLQNLEDILIKYRVLRSSVTQTGMQDLHLSTLYCALKGSYKYKYHISFKTKIVMMNRLFIAFFVPACIWRSFSTILRK